MRMSLPRKCAALLIVPLLCMATPKVWTFAQTANKAATERELIERERAIIQAIAKGDKAVFLASVADDGFWVLGGFVQAPRLVDAFGEFKFSSSEITNPHVVWVDPTTAIVIYAWTGTGTIFNRPFVPKVASTVWTKRSDRWIAVYHHESDAPEQ